MGHHPRPTGGLIVRGVLPLCRGAVDVFYSPSRQDGRNLCMHSQTYISMCMYVCFFVCGGCKLAHIIYWILIYAISRFFSVKLWKLLLYHIYQSACVCVCVCVCVRERERNREIINNTMAWYSYFLLFYILLVCVYVDAETERERETKRERKRSRELREKREKDRNI